MNKAYSKTRDTSTKISRIQLFRNLLIDQELNGYLVPRSDEYQGETVVQSSERLSWLTGFTGSAGLALILRDRAVLFVDGRYQLQVREQTDATIFDYKDFSEQAIADYLINLGPRLTIGYDPMLHTVAFLENFRNQIHFNEKVTLRPVKRNLIDQIWLDRPDSNHCKISIHPLEYTGKTFEEKLSELTLWLQRQKADFLFVTNPSSTSWLLNIRSNDLPNTPVVRAFCLVTRDGGAELFIDSSRISNVISNYLSHSCKISPPSLLDIRLQSYGQQRKIGLLDPNLTVDYYSNLFSKAGGIVLKDRDPIELPRAIKNTTELEGSRRAHLRDGVALVKFLFWLENQPVNSVTEISASNQLYEFRASVALSFKSELKDLSFPTICGSGPNGAIIHYQATNRTNRYLQNGELLLIDSGGQYLDATTDVTRTVPIGTVNNVHRTCFTLVLKGLISISTARFPRGTRGCDLDVLARISLWKNGMDYAHGTGHGVGSYLSVHEGPQTLSPKGTQILYPGMIISNEPGYYCNNHFGLRIENLLVVTSEKSIFGGPLKMLGFETLTFVPIDRRLIDSSLLTNEECLWLNEYHEKVFSALAPHLTQIERDWCQKMTQEIVPS